MIMHVARVGQKENRSDVAPERGSYANASDSVGERLGPFRSPWPTQHGLDKVLALVLQSMELFDFAVVIGEGVVVAVTPFCQRLFLVKQVPEECVKQHFYQEPIRILSLESRDLILVADQHDYPGFG